MLPSANDIIGIDSIFLRPRVRNERLVNFIDLTNIKPR